jgi:hypothetical protein
MALLSHILILGQIAAVFLDDCGLQLAGGLRRRLIRLRPLADFVVELALLLADLATSNARIF